MQIAFIGQKGIPNLGGKIEKTAEEISVRLTRNGHDVFVYTLSSYTPKEYRRYEGVNLISIPQCRINLLNTIIYYLVACFRVTFIERVSVVHWQKNIGMALGLILRILRPNLRQVMSVVDESIMSNKLYKSFFPLLTFSMDQLIVNSALLQRYFLCNHNLSAKLIYDGVSLDDHVETQSRTLKQLGLDRNQYIVYGSNDMNHEQDVEYLISAFLDAKRRSFRWQGFKLVIISDFNHRFGERLHGLIEKRSDLLILGDQAKMNSAELLANAFLVVYPGELEINSLLEAMSYGTGILLANVKKNLPLIDSGLGKVTAFDFEYKDVDDLAGKLELLFLNPSIVKSVGKQAKKYVALYHSWHVIVSELEKVYRQVVLVDDIKIDRKQLSIPAPLRV